MSIKAQYKALKGAHNGKWGIKILGEATLAQGHEVTLQTKNGATKVEKIGLKLWEGKDDDGTPVQIWTKLGEETAVPVAPAPVSNGDADRLAAIEAKLDRVLLLLEKKDGLPF